MSPKTNTTKVVKANTFINVNFPLNSDPVQ